MLAILGGVGWYVRLDWPYFAGLAVGAVIASYHYTLIRARERDKCFKAFLHNNWIGAAIFAGLATSYLLA
jgi:4-hydroxybenzoate polyprenyltransferase